MTTSNEPSEETTQQGSQPAVEEREIPNPTSTQQPQMPTKVCDTVMVERDVWWGSYSGRAMLPSSSFAVLISGAVWWTGVAYVDDELLRLLLFGLAGGILAFQAFRWAYRFFGYEYRLTTRRLVQGKGFLYGRPAEMELSSIVEVKPTRNSVEAMVGVGRISVASHDKSKPPLLLESIRSPFAVAELIQTHVDGARRENMSEMES